MTDFSHDGGVWSARVIGAVAGSAISLVYLLPKGRREAAVRFLTGVCCGMIFGGPAGLWIVRKLDVAADRLSRARTAPASREWSGWLVPLGQRLEALQWLQRGVAAEARDDMAGREQALAAYERALSIRPDVEPAKTRRVALRTALVEDYHRAAVVHFRNQRVDESLALWDKALALDPGFQPAIGYRTRALEIKRRLDRLEQDDPR